MRADQLRSALAGLANVTVLSSSDSTQPSSYESKDWENGAFTKVFLRFVQDRSPLSAGWCETPPLSLH